MEELINMFKLDQRLGTDDFQQKFSELAKIFRISKIFIRKHCYSKRREYLYTKRY